MRRLAAHPGAPPRALTSDAALAISDRASFLTTVPSFAESTITQGMPRTPNCPPSAARAGLSKETAAHGMDPKYCANDDGSRSDDTNTTCRQVRAGV